jgi:dynein heavy chain, axonemal
VLAGYVSVLFFCVADMACIDPMYQYSLSYFISLFLRSIEMSERNRDVSIRLGHLQDHFTFFLFINVCRSLFEAHKLLFAFNLSTKLSLLRKEVQASQLKFLLTGGIAMENAHKNPAEKVLSDKAWGKICRLNDLGGRFDGFRVAMAADVNSWIEYACPLCSRVHQHDMFHPLASNWRQNVGRVTTIASSLSESR